MSEFKPRRCRECGEGTVRPFAKAGRTTPYRNIPALAIPSEVSIPTCDRCGVEWIDGPTAKALEEVMARVYGDELRSRLMKALDHLMRAADIPQSKIEQLLGLSQGYLSRLKNERGEPSPQLVSALALVAKDPERRLKELSQVWGQT